VLCPLQKDQWPGFPTAISTGRVLFQTINKNRTVHNSLSFRLENRNKEAKLSMPGVRLFCQFHLQL
jgi:hypothetical protein